LNRRGEEELAPTALLSRIVAEWWSEALRHEWLTIQARSPFSPVKAEPKATLQLTFDYQHRPRIAWLEMLCIKELRLLWLL
jgi:lipopolysaccharide biosynthesis glycosyltransferase